jgi:hypothetical protein
VSRGDARRTLRDRAGCRTEGHRGEVSGITEGRRSALLALAAGVLLGLAPQAGAQSGPSDKDVTISVNYVYAAQLGFGTYHVGGLSVNVYSLPLEYTVRDVLLDWRLRIGFPILYGDYSFRKTVVLDEFDDVPVKILADQRTLSAEPKLRLEIPVLEPWTVSPIGA